MSRDINDVYSSTVSHIFYKPSSALSENPLLTTCEYWFDNDLENTVSIPFSASIKLNISNMLPASDLTPGLHSIHMRFRDNQKMMSGTLSSLFYKIPHNLATSDLITGYRYWLDDDIENAEVIQLGTPVQKVSLSGIINLTEVPSGDYLIHFQFHDNRGVWSSVTTDNITVNSIPLGISEDPFGIASVFPNPTSGKLTIKMENSSGEVQITVSDIQGKPVHRVSAGGEKILNIDIDGPEGVYFITLTANNRKKIFRVIKN